MYYGECVEVSDLTNEVVFKKFWSYCDKPNNHLDVDEYRIENNGVKPDHSSKLVYSIRYKFCQKEGLKLLKVCNLQF